MRMIKLFAVIGLAVALVAVPALAARVTIEISGTKAPGPLFIQVDSRTAVNVPVDSVLARGLTFSVIALSPAPSVTIEISGTAQAGALFIQVDNRAPVSVPLTAGQAITAVRDAIVSALNAQQAGTASAIDTNRLTINAREIKIGEASDRMKPLPQPIKDVRDAIVTALNNQQPGTAEAIGTNQILIIADKEIKIGEAADRLTSLPFEKDKEVKARGLTFKVVTVAVPTLTEWGLIALAVLLAGGMGYMIYRRRPALRPAAP